MSAPTDPRPKVTRQQSIKRRVVRLVLIPGLVAVLLWLVASAYLVFQGYHSRSTGNAIRQVSAESAAAVISIEYERRLSVAFLARPSQDKSQLLDTRRQTDAQVATIRAAGEKLGHVPDSVKTSLNTLIATLDQLPAIRKAVDAESISSGGALDMYNRLFESLDQLFDAQARAVPDVKGTQGEITSVEMGRGSDLQNRAASVIDAALISGGLSRADYLEFVKDAGAYHYMLDYASQFMDATNRQQYAAVQQSPAWKQLVATEDAITAAGPWHDGQPSTVPINRAQWATLTTQVSNALLGVIVGNETLVSAQSVHAGNQKLLIPSLGSLLALLIAVGAILWAVRQSSVLVDRALSVRLAKLGRDADTLVDERLPAVMNRLRRREQVDLNTEFVGQDYGGDEIGQVANVINRSLRAAAGAATDEAKARAAGTAIVMGVARRPQRPLQRGLKVVEDLQSQIGDEKLLTNLFDIHHQLNQTRRFLENLVILAGGQSGRRFQNPVPLRRVLLAAFAETRDYQRISLRVAPDVALVGHAVAGVLHIVAELLDNALAFSPPGSTVWVSASMVNAGVAVEIEDAGVGMPNEMVDQSNRLLATATTPDVTELKDGAQVGLHVVAELAKREGVQVSLRRSAYGGLLVIVLLPGRLLTSGAEGRDPDGTPVSPATPASPAPSPRHNRVDSLDVPTVAAVAVMKPENVESLPPRRPETLAPRQPETLPRRQPETQQPQPQQPMSPQPLSPQPSSLPRRHKESSKPPLPHRRPQEHLAPGLRDEPEMGAGPTRSPEEAQARFARYQQGRNAGRAATGDGTVTDAERGMHQ
ncbi:nitrate- and nitrite sensing domain-containing protein [Actinoplanes sp. TBRC 11911]|uniref:sensor histidine kinase n=1 Tax=Actinoplanes sp. TBRC 11911 TaxID=2729386 RepID=UPI002898FB46|nr:nitrate- and nitrite sensing domain-containing protein [Actinoplanes sp. TBRC 11911]